jgi:UDPglucose 6-dehydrogenase
LYAGLELKVLTAVEEANDVLKHVLSGKMKVGFGTNLKGMHLALWGLAFKASTDDVREAASREAIADLSGMGAPVTACDPVARHEAQKIYATEPRLTFSENPMTALDAADALVIVTEWKEFRSPDFAAIKSKLKNAVIFDGRNL